MKSYILKSLIIFVMVLTLGLILIPIVPTEKEVIEVEKVNYWELLEVNTLTLNGLMISEYVDNYNFGEWEYLAFSFQPYVINFSLQPIIIITNQSRQTILLGYNDAIAYTVSVWGVSK